MVRAEPDTGNQAAGPTLFLDMSDVDGVCIVRARGELDVATCDQLVAAVTSGRHGELRIDLGGLTFMDCSGYSSLVTSRLLIEGDGGSLTITGQTGQPARLCKLIAELEAAAA